MLSKQHWYTLQLPTIPSILGRVLTYTIMVHLCSIFALCACSLLLSVALCSFPPL